MEQSLDSVLQDLEKHMVQMKSEGREPAIMHHSPYRCEIAFEGVAGFATTFITIKNNRATLGNTVIYAEFDDEIKELARVDIPLKEALGHFHDLAAKVFGHPIKTKAELGPGIVVTDEMIVQLFGLPKKT